MYRKREKALRNGPSHSTTCRGYNVSKKGRGDGVGVVQVWKASLTCGSN